MAEQRLIDANHIVEVAERAWNAWNLAMATQDTNRGVNKVIKRQELCKAVKAVADDAPTIDPESLPIVQQLRAELERVTAERDKIAQYELDACGEYCFGDSSTGIPECEWLDSNGRCKLKEWVKENTAGKGDGLNESAQETAGERLP